MSALLPALSNEEGFPTFLPYGRDAGAFGPLLNRQIFGTPAQPAVTAGDIVLAVYSLPADVLNYGAGQVGDNVGLRIRAVGAYGATGNNKTVKLIWNPTTAVVGSAVVGGQTLASSGVVAINALGFQIGATVYEVAPSLGASKSQIGFQDVNQNGATVVSPPAPVALTAPENQAILIAVTGNAATAVSDILLSLFEIVGLA